LTEFLNNVILLTYSGVAQW